MSNPTSTVRSKMTSEMKMTIMLGMFSSGLEMKQICERGSHSERICKVISLDCQTRWDWSLTRTIPGAKSRLYEIPDRKSVLGRENDLPRTMTPTLVKDTAAVIPTINLFLFQIATLGASMRLGKEG